jgi:ribosomal protein S18 acetylase RimI-like enzyme
MPEKKLLLESQGYKVYEVDGAEVREDVSVTFSGGDNWAHSAKVPKNEIWVEAGKAHGDLCLICLHELVEAVLMSEKEMDYDEAHILANTIEGFVRKTGDLAEALAVLGEAAELPEATIKKIAALYTELEGSEKKAEVSSRAYLGEVPEVENPEVAPLDPYEEYLTGALGSEGRRGRVFDLATGTRWKGLRGLKDRLTAGIGEYSAMLGSGVKPWDDKFNEKMTAGTKKTLDNGVSVDRMFGRRMRPLEAISTLGFADLPRVTSLASDPMTWARAFGNAAKTPVERAKARKTLHAALSLRDLKNGVSFDPKKLQLLWAGLGEKVQKQYRMPGTSRNTPFGTKQLPSVKDIMNAPVLNPAFFSDSEHAADLMTKMSSEDPRTKIAEDLQGGSRVAKYPLDPEEHLYHVEKRDGKTVGMVKVAPRESGKRYHITNFWVKPGLRSQGIGKALFKRVIELYGDKELTLDSEVFDKSPLSQKALDAFYEKHGFTKGEGLRMTRPAGGPPEKLGRDKTAAMRFLHGLIPGIVRPVAQAAPRLAMPQAPVGREVLLSRILARLRQGAPGHYRKLQQNTLKPLWARRAQEGLRATHGELMSRGFQPKLSADKREQLSRLWVKLAGLRTFGQFVRSLRDPFTTGALSRSALALGHRGVAAGGGLGKALIGASRVALPVARRLEAVPEVIGKLPGSLRSYTGNMMFDLRGMYQRLRGRQTPMRSMRLEAQRNKFNDSLPDRSWVQRLMPGPKLAPTTPAQHAELNKIDYRTVMPTGGAPGKLTFSVTPAERARIIDDYRRKNLTEYIRYHNRYRTAQSPQQVRNVVPQARTETFAMTPRIGPPRAGNVVPQTRTETFTLPPPIRGITL